MDMVPRWFEMLKELRNGTISYIQLIKREQIRPPVRPVCRRLGVAKLSDIVSEDILYRAIVQVAESQSQGLRAARAEDNNGWNLYPPLFSTNDVKLKLNPFGIQN